VRFVTGFGGTLQIKTKPSNQELRVLEVVRGGWHYPNEIASLLGMQQNHLAALLARLVKKGQIFKKHHSYYEVSSGTDND